MKIAVVGAGKLGMKVVNALVGGNHSITVIDKNEAILNKISQQYDVLVSLRQLLLTAAVLCLFCIPCFAGEWSVSLGMNGGDADTITGIH